MIARILVCILTLTFSAAGCTREGSGPPGKGPPPAVVAKPANESELATITLTADAERRLGLRTAPVQRKPMPRRRTLGGEVVFPPGRAITVSAPVSGTLAVPTGGAVPLPGAAIAKGQPIFSILPLLVPEHSVLTPAEQVQFAESRASLATSQIDAQRDVSAAELEVGAARLAMDRAEQLLRDKAGSRQMVDEASVRCQLAEKFLESARARFEFLEKTKLESDAGLLVHQSLVAPVSGVLRNLTAIDGETVVQGEPLFEIINTEQMWIRVPIYVGQWNEIDASQDVIVKEFGQPADAEGLAAMPVVAPPSANPIAATVDLFYELANHDARLRPGHKVAVSLPVVGEAESLVVPWAAVLYDFNGGSWVYERIGPQTYLRRRVDVEFVIQSEAVLARGPEPGTEVVTDAAAELFGTEFGFGK